VSRDNVNLPGHSLVAVAAEDIAQEHEVPVLSGTKAHARHLARDDVGARLEVRRVDPMTTSAVTNSSTTGTPFLSRISRGRNTTCAR